jgi:hypothetical protein
MAEFEGCDIEEILTEKLKNVRGEIEKSKTEVDALDEKIKLGHLCFLSFSSTKIALLNKKFYFCMCVYN